MWWRWRGNNGKDVEWLPFGGRICWLSRIVKGVELRTFSRMVFASDTVLYMTDLSKARFKKCSLSTLRP